MNTTRTLSSPVCNAGPEPLAPAGAAGTAGGWRQNWARPAFWRSWLLLLSLMFGVVVPCVPAYFSYIQSRAGRHLPDPLLALLPRHDVSAAIFVLIWGAVVLGVGWLCFHPMFFLRGMWALLVLLLLRMSTIWLLPLEPPAALLPLADPLTARLFHTSAADITKDLFFSGHTATVTLLAMAVRGRWWRRTLGLMALAVGVLVLVQRVHYTYDVLAAPLFTWLAYWLGGHIARLAAAPARPPLNAS